MDCNLRRYLQGRQIQATAGFVLVVQANNLSAGANPGCQEWPHKQKDRLAAVSPKFDQVFWSGGCNH